jgi:hypothetical protein
VLRGGIRRPGRRRRRARGRGDDGRDRRAVRRDRRALQQRRHLASGRRVHPRHVRRGLAARPGREREGRLPLLQARPPAADRARRRLDRQRRLVRRHPRRRDLADLLYGLEGRRPVDDARARRTVRAPEHPCERALSGPSRDAAAALDLRRRSGRARAAAHPLADGTPGETSRDRQRRAVPRLGRVELRERRDVRRRRRADGRLRDARVAAQHFGVTRTAGGPSGTP